MEDQLSPKQQLRKSSSVLGKAPPSQSPSIRAASPGPGMRSASPSRGIRSASPKPPFRSISPRQDIRSVSPRPKADSPYLGPDRTKDGDRLFDVDLLAEEARADEVVQTLSQHNLDVTGWRLKIILLALFVGLFLSFLDTTIVGVALTTIASRFEAFENSSWVFTAYLLTYMAFGIILARLSDFFGLKSIEIFSFLFFLAFSAACGVAKNMTQLIIFRSFQGIGGSGLFSMTLIICLTIFKIDRIGEVATWIAFTQAIAMVLGPVLSGAITHDQNSDDWRWIFYMNLPLGGLALLGLLVAWPKSTRAQNGNPYRLSVKKLEGVDFVGAALLLVAGVMLIFSLQEAATEAFEWNSGVIIESFVISGVGFVAFIIWEAWVGWKKDSTLKPILLIKVVSQRVVASALLVSVLNGFVWYLIILTLPIRYQLVHGDTSTLAGARLLPMAFASAAGTFVAGGICRKRNFTGYTTIAASAIQLAGYGLMSTLSLEGSPTDIDKSYGYSVLIGFGFGLSIASTTLLTIYRFLPEPHHHAVMQGCMTQMRSLGGSIGLAIATIIFNRFVRAIKELADLLPDEEPEELYRNPLAMSTWDEEVQSEVGYVYSKAFRVQMRVAMYVAAAALVVSLGCWERKAPVVEVKSERRVSMESEQGA